ncbi:MAG: two-component regulator propeller domain-containing protein, partial [Rhodothermales bacterium]|nr:two-component regulator propeller domain-containing protein [Rhodothermales bacterium]
VDFGVVVFDAEQAEVVDTYERFGTFPGGAAVRDVLFAPLPDGAPGIWVATDEGVAYAPLSAPILREPGVWTAEADSPESVLSLAYFDGRVWAGAEQRSGDEEAGVFVRDADGWERLGFTPRSVPDLLVRDGRIVVVSPFLVYVRSEGGSGVGSNRLLLGEDTFSLFQAGVYGPDGRLWVGDAARGLFAFPDLVASGQVEVPPAAAVLPSGPLTNTILDFDLTPDGTLWVGYDDASSFINGFGRLDEGGWTNFSTESGALSDRADVQEVHASADGSVWFGTVGSGVYRVTPEGEIARYTQENSTLDDAPGSPGYVVSLGIGTDEAGRAWVTNRFTPFALHVWTPEGEWHALRQPAAIPSNLNFAEVYIDRFGQKWVTLVRPSLSGYAVIDTGDDPLSTDDDRAIYVGAAGSAGEGLPSEGVNAFAEDLDGRMWIGTERGLAVVFSPGSVFAGDPSLAQPTWARTADGNDFFLRDLRIFDIAVDPANGKWLASSNGVWLLNAEGNAVVEHFTSANSPLPDDVVVAVDVDPRTGAVYFATGAGIYVWRGEAVVAAEDADDLFVYPNPFRPAEHADGIRIRGLLDGSDVRVLTVDGQVVAAFSTRGGSVRWDGRDQRTGAPVPSGVYIVAATADGETSYGKVAVLR